MRRELSLLVVDDNPAIHKMFGNLVAERPDIRLQTAEDGEQALDFVRTLEPDVAVVDLEMPVMDGMKFLSEALKIRSSMDVVILTAYGSIERAVEAMKLGAADFLTKPFKPSQVLLLLDRLRKFHELMSENQRLREELGERYRVRDLVGRTPAMKRVHNIVDRVRDENCNVLVVGESGTGKELVARAIHYDGCRNGCPFVAVDCGALHPTLLESELFGHVRGAFTGAEESKVGLFERASGGTLFLDEVAEMPASVQPALLRALEEKRIRPVGSAETIEVDARVIAATSRNLEAEVAAKRFRRDLFYRLNVVTVQLPPLRTRKEDVPLLAEHFLKKRGKKRLTREVCDRLLRHDWPGNVRELENIIERACALGDRPEIRSADLPDFGDDRVTPGRGRSLRDMEVREIRSLLKQHNGSTAAVAGILGINRSTLYRKIKRFGIDLDDYRDNGQP